MDWRVETEPMTTAMAALSGLLFSSSVSSNYQQVLAQQNITGTTTDAARTWVGDD
jgi:hypothetical protein